jgi:hypothetical protein
MEWLKGYKTYILVTLGALTVLINYLSGDVTLAEFLSSEDFLALMGLLGLGALRSGVKNKVK